MSDSVEIGKEIIRYSNVLERYNVSNLSSVEQNLIELIFRIWTKKPNEQTKIDLALIKERLGLTREKDSYLRKIIIKTGYAIINKSFVCNDNEVGYLIYYFQINDETQQLEISTTPAFMDLFRAFNRCRYTEYDLLTFLKINSKQGKNIYCLCHKYFHKNFTMDWTDFRNQLGYKETANTKNIMTSVRKAIDYLLDCKIFKEIVMTPIYGSGRGRPIEKVSFKFDYPDNENKSNNKNKTVTLENTQVEITPKLPETGAQDVKGVKVPSEETENPHPESVEKHAPVQEQESEPFPVEPFNPDDVKSPTSEEERQAVMKGLPNINDVINEMQQSIKPGPEQKTSVTPADELKKIERKCPVCETQMVIRENGNSHELFFACPNGWNGPCAYKKTEKLSSKEAEIYWKYKK